jgi:tripartite-type tricarboxylate transporter receptor subunit TctC
LLIECTPQAIVDRLDNTMKKIIMSAAIKERMESVGFVTPEQNSAAGARLVRSDLELWTWVSSTAGRKAN